MSDSDLLVHQVSHIHDNWISKKAIVWIIFSYHFDEGQTFRSLDQISKQYDIKENDPCVNQVY